ncbi:MAG: HipA domain-containing protein [Gammaproteobacteria bacterium]
MIWTRLGAQPVKMGILTVTDQQARFTYEADYASTGLRGLGLIYPPDEFTSTIVRERSEYFDFHPPIQNLVPPHSERNFQRALLLRYLDTIHVQVKSGFETDWEILIRAGHGGIGHLDVFESDEDARQWYSTPSRRDLVEADDRFGFSLREFMTWFDDKAGTLIDLLGPTPTVGGAIPKLPLSIPRTGWDGRIGLPTRYGDSDRSDIILKLENTATYPGITELEKLGLDMHRMAGFDVPRYWPVRIGGLRGLAVERFDRTPDGIPVFFESLYSILASGSRTVSSHYSASYDRIAQAIDNPRVQLVDDRRQAKKHLFERLIMALLTGNGDLHLQNLGIIERDGKLAFSPVYDPAPMRAYQIHDMLTPPGMTFGDYGDFPADLTSETPVSLELAIARFAHLLGIRKADSVATIDRLVTLSADYPDRIEALTTLPTENKQQLTKVHRQIRSRLEKLISVS